MTHAKLAPSAAYQWGPDRCPASAMLQRKFPEDGESERAREGTAAHHAATEPLAGRPVGKHAPNGVPIDQAMLEGAEYFIRDVRDTLAAASPGTVARIEEYVSAAKSVHPDNGGTPDAYIIDVPKRTVHVWDYKYGHLPHDAFQHYQLLNYLMAILESNGYLPDVWGEWSCSMTIVQPRCFDGRGVVRDAFMHGVALAKWAERFRNAAHRASQPDAPTVTGDWCTHCTARVHCQAYWNVCGTALDVSARQVIVNPDPRAVGVMLTEIEIAEARLKAMRTGLTATAVGLGGVPGWAMTSKDGNLAWTVPVEEAVALGEMMGVPLVKPGVLTPTQAVKAGIPADLIGAYASRSSSVALRRDDGTAAARVFGEL